MYKLATAALAVALGISLSAIPAMSADDNKTLKNGFAFAMQCKGTKTILTYEFGKDPSGQQLVRGTIQTLIKAAPKYSSSILIMMRRVGDCPGQTPAKAL